LCCKLPNVRKIIRALEPLQLPRPFPLYRWDQGPEREVTYQRAYVLPPERKSSDSWEQQRNRTALPAPLLICLSEWACVDPEGIRHWPNMNWKVLEHVPLLLYILAAKTLILCLAFAGVKIYQRKRLEAKQQKLEAEKKTQSEKKEN
uniref:Uncharacterized protein n=1 Tax=Ursus americanus TaxID=9643 RepID=A0A452SVZ4_URSAM